MNKICYENVDVQEERFHLMIKKQKDNFKWYKTNFNRLINRERKKKFDNEINKGLRN